MKYNRSILVLILSASLFLMLIPGDATAALLCPRGGCGSTEPDYGGGGSGGDTTTSSYQLSIIDITGGNFDKGDQVKFTVTLVNNDPYQTYGLFDLKFTLSSQDVPNTDFVHYFDFVYESDVYTFDYPKGASNFDVTIVLNPIIADADDVLALNVGTYGLDVSVRTPDMSWQSETYDQIIDIYNSERTVFGVVMYDPNFASQIAKVPEYSGVKNFVENLLGNHQTAGVGKIKDGTITYTSYTSYFGISYHLILKEWTNAGSYSSAEDALRNFEPDTSNSKCVRDGGIVTDVVDVIGMDDPYPNDDIEIAWNYVDFRYYSGLTEENDAKCNAGKRDKHYWNGKQNTITTRYDHGFDQLIGLDTGYTNGFAMIKDGISVSGFNGWDKIQKSQTERTSDDKKAFSFLHKMILHEFSHNYGGHHRQTNDDLTPEDKYYLLAQGHLLKYEDLYFDNIFPLTQISIDEMIHWPLMRPL